MSDPEKLVIEALESLDSRGDPDRRDAINAAIAAWREAIEDVKRYREYYEAVRSHPVNYSQGNYARVLAAIAAIERNDDVLHRL